MTCMLDIIDISVIIYDYLIVTLYQISKPIHHYCQYCNELDLISFLIL